jgi:hypothetical protein
MGGDPLQIPELHHFIPRREDLSKPKSHAALIYYAIRLNKRMETLVRDIDNLGAIY